MLKINKVKNDWKGELPSGLTWYFVGQPKTGKTTNASKWSAGGQEKVLLIDTDLGSDFVNGANVVTCGFLNTPARVKEVDGVKVMKNGKPQVEAIPPEERGYFYRSGPDKGKPMPVYALGEILKDLEANWNEYGIDTVVIDTLDQVNQWIEETVCKDMGLTDVSEGDWGSGWAAARKKNVDIIIRLQAFLKKVGGNLVLISHSKQTAMTDSKAQLSPQLPSGLARSVTAKADVIGYTTCDKESGGYNLSFESYDERMIGSRLRPLAQKVIPFDYETIIKTIKSYKEEGE